MPEKKITIEIIRETAKAQTQSINRPPQNAGKGVIRSRRENDYLARRLKKGGFINFYDLGEWLNDETGLFVDDAYAVIPTVAEINDTVHPTDYGAEILAAQNKPLDIPVDTWKTHFHKIGYEEAEKYRLSLDIGNAEPELIKIDNPNWTPQGLKTDFPDFNILSFKNAPLSENKVYYDPSGTIFINGIFRYFFSGDSSFKITSSPDFDSDPVEPVFTKGNIDIYINRTIAQITGFKEADSGGGKELQHFYSALPKSVFGNDSLRHERNPIDEEVALINDMLIAQTTHPDARQLSYTIGNIYSADGSIGSWDGTESGYTYGLTYNEIRDEGMLVMAINKGADWYFVWWNS